MKEALGRFATGVVVLTVHEDRDDIGMTATAFASVSLEPPLILVGLSTASYVAEVLRRRDTWAVSLLAGDQKHVAGRFAVAGRPSGRLLLATLPHHRGPRTGALIVERGLAALECRTRRLVPAGDHTLVLGDVLGVDYMGPAEDPLVRYMGGYRGLA